MPEKKVEATALVGSLHSAGNAFIKGVGALLGRRVVDVRLLFLLMSQPCYVHTKVRTDHDIRLFLKKSDFYVGCGSCLYRTVVYDYSDLECG